MFVLFLAGCANASNDDENILFIEDRFFVVQNQQIFMNPNNYIGRTIRYEGMFWGLPWGTDGEDVYVVFRFAGGCCGNDGIVGFELDLGDTEPLENDSWVEVTGVLEMMEYGDGEFLWLTDVVLIEMEERGAESVPF